MTDSMAMYKKKLKVDVVQGTHRLILSFLEDIEIKSGDAIVVHVSNDGIWSDFSVFQERDDAPLD